MLIQKSTVAALALALSVTFAVPSLLPEAGAATKQTAQQKTKKKQYGTVERKKQNFRAARPDEYYRIFGCDDFSLSIQPYCVDGRYPYFNPYTHPQTGR